MKSRFIGDNLRLTKDALHTIKSLHPQDALVALDFSKALDTVRWDFIYAALGWLTHTHSLDPLLELMQQFSDWSGLKIN